MNVSAFAKASAQCHRVLRMHSCAADFLRRTSEQLILRILRRIRLAGKQKAVAEPDFAFAAADDPSSGFDGKKRLHLVVRQSAGYAFSALSRWVRQHIKLPCVGLKGNTPSPASIAATRASLFQTELCGFRNWHPQFPLSRSLGLRSRTRPNPAKSESFRIPFLLGWMFRTGRHFGQRTFPCVFDKNGKHSRVTAAGCHRASFALKAS